MSDEWVIVPRDATDAMVDAALDAKIGGKVLSSAEIYRAMLDDAPAAPQQVEPVAQIGWADEFGNLFPMGAWKPTQRTHHDSHKAAWRPVFLHPPADEVRRLRDALDEIDFETQDVSIQQIARKALEGK